jgi:hypothetical protein
MIIENTESEFLKQLTFETLTKSNWDNKPAGILALYEGQAFA